MCGIAGYSLVPEENIDARVLARSLLLGIEHRGKDATGIAFQSPASNVPYIVKNDIPATKFVRKHLRGMPAATRLAICHTRFGTQGLATNPYNNHPIVTGRTIGVHNGMISNDNELFREMGVVHKRLGEVDSEAAFAAISYGLDPDPDNEDKPRLKGASKLTDVLERIQGSAALAWMDMTDNPDVLHGAAIYSSPFCWAKTKAGSFIFASTTVALRDAAEDVGVELELVNSLLDGTYIKVVRGEVVEIQEFQPPWSSYKSSYGGYSTTSDYYTTSYTQPSKPGSTFRQNADGECELIHDDDEVTEIIDVYENELEAEPEEFSMAAIVVNRPPRLSQEVYNRHHKDRERNIDKYIDKVDKSGGKKFPFISDLHGFLRPGHKVVTFFGDSRVEGNVVELPTTFPEGLYVLRVFVDSSNEYVLVVRTADEFTQDDNLSYDTPTLPPTGQIEAEIEAEIREAEALADVQDEIAAWKAANDK